MTIKALHGEKVLYLLALAGAMTFGSCGDDNNYSGDEDEPEAPQVDPTPIVPVTPASLSYRINEETKVSFNSNDTIIANTCVDSMGGNSTLIGIDVILADDEIVDESSVSFTFSNEYQRKVSVSGVPSYSGSIYSITIPAIEGIYSLAINKQNFTFNVIGSQSLNDNSRNFSNIYTVVLNSENSKSGDFEFTPFTKTKEGSVNAKISGKGDFLSLDENGYNKYISSDKAIFSAKMNDAAKNSKDWESSLINENYFTYKSGDKFYLGKVVDFVGESLVEATEIKLSITY